MADFCWRGNMWWKAESVKEIRYIGSSKIKSFAKAKDLKEKPKHTLPEKILHLRSYILIESPIEIPQFAFIKFPESLGYTTESLLFKAWEVSGYSISKFQEHNLMNFPVEILHILHMW